MARKYKIEKVAEDLLGELARLVREIRLGLRKLVDYLVNPPKNKYETMAFIAEIIAFAALGFAIILRAWR